MQIQDYVGLSKSRTTGLFADDAVYEAFIQAAVALCEEKQLELQELETTLLNIDLSIGNQLDLIGKIVGQDRNLVLFTADPFFGFAVPTSCQDVPDEILIPKNTWSDGGAYDEQARHLARLFTQNFEQYREGSSEAIINAGPRA